jgi:hypothetical protein
MTREEFNQYPTGIYWAAQPPEVRDMRQISIDDNYIARQNEAVRLAAMGMTIDIWIDVYGVQPYEMMVGRMQTGRIDHALLSGKSIKNSIDPVDYPPFDTPIPAPPPPSTKPAWRVGVLALQLAPGGPMEQCELWQPELGAQLVAGQTYKDDRGSFVVITLPNPMGVSMAWRKVA